MRTGPIRLTVPRGALLEHFQQLAVRAELVGAHVVEQPGGAADVQLLLVLGGVGECGAERVEERAFARAQRRIGEALAQQSRPEREPSDSFVQVFARPAREARVDGAGEAKDALGDPAGGRDHDDHHDIGLQAQHFDAVHGRGLERRRGDECEQMRDLRQHLRRRLQCGVDLAADGRQVERKRTRPRLEAFEDGARIDAIAALGRHASGGGVRVRKQTVGFQSCELVAHGRRRHAHVGALDERLRADRLPRRDVVLDDEAQDAALAIGELGLGDAHLQENGSPAGGPVRRAGRR